MTPTDYDQNMDQVLADPARLAAIQELELTDSPAEEVFDRLTRLAARLIPSPIALVSIVDEERQFFKSFTGLEGELAAQRQTPLTHSYCKHVVATGQPLIVNDARENALVQENLATTELGIVSYLGMPLATKQGEVLGSFCVIDVEARQWSDDDKETVRELARSVMTEIELRQELLALKAAEADRSELIAKLEAANKDLTDFAHIVSHDLKAPLRGIGSLAEWLSSDYAAALDENGQEMLKLMQRRVARLQDFIEGILRYSRVGRVEEEWEQVDLQVVVDDVVASLAPPDHIKITLLDPLPTVYGGRFRLEQVFQNLVSNAIKFMDKPEGNISIGCARENGHWEIQVTDDGPGIEARHFEKIFHIFQTLTPRDTYESTGIGLTLVKKIVGLHGGSVSVTSMIGDGTTFTVSLPASEEAIQC